MERRNGSLSVIVFFTMAFLLTMGPGYAGAQTPVGQFTSELVPGGDGQKFYGDGAAYDAATGYLGLSASASGAKGNCLACHNEKSTYLKTGHGNMLKKVSANQIWRGATTEPHSLTNPFGHVIDWSTGSGRVNLGGYCDVGGFEGQFSQEDCEAATACTSAKDDFISPAYTATSCVAAGGTWKKGVWTPADRWVDIIYFVGDWMGSAAGYVDTGIKIPERPNKFMMADGRQYGTCGSCHNTGYRASDYTRVQPYADYSNFARDNTSGALGSWVLDGIQCERCHNATDHPANTGTIAATVPSYADSTALCSQCHIRPGAWEYVVIAPNDPPAGGPANLNWATQPTAYPIGASATNFGTHLIGKQFLNSPHGLFTGTFAEIADTSKYNSGFDDGGSCSNPTYTDEDACEGGGGTWTPNRGGCATCHNVHQSTVAAAKENFGSEPMKNQCGINCHSSRASVSRQRHPTGPGTPFKEVAPTQTEWAESCVVCHMPKPAGGTGLNAHVFRINTDPTYSTFPAAGATTPGICSNPDFATTKAVCTDANTGGYCYDANNNRTGATIKGDCIASGNTWKAYTWSLVANSAPEITETGVFEQAVWVDIDLACGQCHGPGGSAHELSKPILAGYAAGMHIRNSTVISCADCHAGTTAAHPAGANTPTDCSGCHGTTKAGVRPTVQAACITCHSSAGIATHQFTEEQIKPYVEAIHAGGSAPSTTCTVCHTGVPETLINHPDKTCTNCHSTAKPGVKPTSAQACNSCHGGSLGRSAFKNGIGPKLGASFMSKEYLVKAATTIHPNVVPLASFVVEAEDVDPVLEGIQVRIDQTVEVIDTSTDQNENLSSILVSWGDGAKTYILPGGSATHSYAKAGKKKISFTAVDRVGKKSKKVTQEVTVLKDTTVTLKK